MCLKYAMARRAREPRYGVRVAAIRISIRRRPCERRSCWHRCCQAGSAVEVSVPVPDLVSALHDLAAAAPIDWRPGTLRGKVLPPGKSGESRPTVLFARAALQSAKAAESSLLPLADYAKNAKAVAPLPAILFGSVASRSQPLDQGCGSVVSWSWGDHKGQEPSKGRQPFCSASYFPQPPTPNFTMKFPVG